MAMNNLPDYLPEILNLDGEWEKKVEVLYSIFLDDFRRFILQRTAGLIIAVKKDKDLLKTEV